MNEDDQIIAVKELIKNFLEPAGADYIDEAAFRYLLTRGDAVGGIMRNKIGDLGQEKFIRAIFSCMNVRGMECDKISIKSTRWTAVDKTEEGAEEKVKGLHWTNSKGERLLVFNVRVPAVGNNVDICLYAGTIREYEKGKIVQHDERAIMFGELKGGIDPAEADEHWKTGNRKTGARKEVCTDT